MAKLSGPQLTQLALNAGFPPADAQTAAAVALAESGGDPNATNPSGAKGLWQILQRAHPELFINYTWNDPAQNAKMAFIVWQQAGNSFRPWTTFTSGRYRLYLNQVGSANGSGVLSGALAGAGTGLTAPGGSADPNTAGASALTDFIGKASDPTFWTRVAMFLAGVFLVGAALHGLLAKSSVYQKLSKAALMVAI
jgi:hypothetical protein